jgi:glycosyltransferase involved in cell wall biosynthesis
MRVDIWWPVIPLESGFDIREYISTFDFPLSGTDSLTVRLAVLLAQHGAEVTLWNKMAHGDSGVPHLTLRIAQRASQVFEQCVGDVLIFNWREDKDSRQLATVLKHGKPLRVCWVHTRTRAPCDYLRPGHLSLLVAVSRSHLEDYRVCSAWDKCTFVYNAIDHEFWSAGALESERTPGRIVFVGTPHETKGLDMLLRAWPYVVTQVPYASLVVVGSVSLHGHIPSGERVGISTKDFEEKFIVPLLEWQDIVRPMHRVVWRGNLKPSELRHELLKAQVCVVNPNPRALETFCVAAVEAAAAGCCVVGAKSGGLSETVQHGRTGYLVRGGVEELAETLIRLLRNPERIRRMGRQGVEWARRFDLKRFINEWISVLDALLSGRGVERSVSWNHSPKPLRALSLELLRTLGILPHCLRVYEKARKKKL